MVFKKRKRIFTKLLPKVYTSITISNVIKEKLLKFGAFKGNYRQKTHFSHVPYLLGIKNEYPFYDINKSILLFITGIRFLKKAIKNRETMFIFAGTPLNKKGQLKFFSSQLNVKNIVFSTENWEPGFISKRIFVKNCILIVYNLTLNYTAYREGVNAKIPVVGFVTPFCDIRGLDYPILLNLTEHPFWYTKLIISLFHKPK